MHRIVRFCLLALVLCTLNSPAFAFACRYCGDDAMCHYNSDVVARCTQYVDHCYQYEADCIPLGVNDSIAGNFTIASVEVVAAH